MVLPQPDGRVLEDRTEGRDQATQILGPRSSLEDDLFEEIRTLWNSLPPAPDLTPESIG